MTDGECVRVALRIRPLVRTEIDKGCQEVVDRIKGEPQIVVKNNDPYTFNYVFAKDETQECVYVNSVQPMIEKLFKGYNVTILAYGQTGSGKTHTMGTSFTGVASPDMGVIPRAMNDIFRKISDVCENDKISVSCSFMELYQENLYDLLANGNREQNAVDIREDVNKGIVIPGLTEIDVSSAEETTACLMKASSLRIVAATAMNEQSSRSHSIFTININIVKNNDMSSMITSKFNLVDLAGSERSKKTKATGDRFKEGININKGLLALGNVISALGSQNSYVSYRDSKLTRLLQDSLGGNSITLMIACISPADYNLDETISTLRYADRARKIKNKPVVNQDPQKAEINRLNTIIQNLRIQLLGKGEDSSLAVFENFSEVPNEIAALRIQNKELIAKNNEMRIQLQVTLNDVTDVETRANIAEEAHDKLLIKFKELKNYFIKTENNETNDLKENSNKIYTIFNEIDLIFKENREELMNHKSESSNNINDATFCAQSEDVQQRCDQFTTKQLEINSRIRKLNRELALKESHHEKVSINLTKFCEFQGSNENLLKESETKIQILEAEKHDLLEQLKSVKDSNISAKLAEERRKRLQVVEHELAETRKKNVQQSKILKLKEREAQKVQNLNNEIKQMKINRVNLLKQMKKESETFRQWKLNREKQLTHLKEKDRKRQNEMARMEALHNKQKNVLKRKVEEAMAVNKRLKDILDKQKNSHYKRNLSNNQTGKMDQIISMFDHDIELILSVIDAEITLEQLMEDRAAVNNRLKELKSENLNTHEISALENDLCLRNAQIDDLQVKILSSDITSKIKTICESLSNLSEAKGILIHLFNLFTELRREYAAKDNKIGEYKSAIETTEEKLVILEQKITDNENRFCEMISNAEKSYEEKISVLLRELNKQPQQKLDGNNDPEATERILIQQEALDKVDILREELEYYKAMYNEYQKNKDNHQKKKKVQNKEITEEIEDDQDIESFLSDEDIDFENLKEDSFSNDPDWINSPMYRKQKQRNSRHKSILARETFLNPNAVKRNSDGITKCGCKTSCKSKRCSCRSSNSGCSERCNCEPSLCENKGQNDTTLRQKTEKENVNLSENDSKSFETNAVTESYNEYNSKTSILQTPKKFKSMADEEQNILDVTTPTYPFKFNKRNPFYKNI